VNKHDLSNCHGIDRLYEYILHKLPESFEVSDLKLRYVPILLQIIYIFVVVNAVANTVACITYGVGYISGKMFILLSVVHQMTSSFCRSYSGELYNVIAVLVNNNTAVVALRFRKSRWSFARIVDVNSWRR